jgi:hypothetical protein
MVDKDEENPKSCILQKEEKRPRLNDSSRSHWVCQRMDEDATKHSDDETSRDM